MRLRERAKDRRTQKDTAGTAVTVGAFFGERARVQSRMAHVKNLRLDADRSTYVMNSN